MNVQWYPGTVLSLIGKICFVEKDHTRLVFSQLINIRISAGKRNSCIYKLNDQIDQLDIFLHLTLRLRHMAWMEYFKEKGIYAVSIDSRNKGSMKAVSAAITEACKEKTERDRRRGIKNRPVRAMVAGY